MSLAGMPRTQTDTTNASAALDHASTTAVPHPSPCMEWTQRKPSHTTHDLISHGMDHTRGSDGTEIYTGTLSHRDDWKRHRDDWKRHTGEPTDLVYSYTDIHTHSTEQLKQNRTDRTGRLSIDTQNEGQTDE